MDVTVILCTYNRSQLLPKALESVAASALPESIEWEVVVVDNNSKDRTREVVEGFCCRYPARFRYVLESRQGLSHARNAGIRGARGRVLAFMDDDVIVDPGWLWNLTQGLMSGEWAGAGGRVLPVWTCALPRWLSSDDPHALAPFVFFDHGLEPGPLHEPAFGANMAFQRAMFEKYGGFRTDLGRCGDNLLSNEDTELGRRLLDGGERLRYEPSAVVNHPVAENRLQKKYLLAWEFGKAQGNMRESGIAPGTKWFAFGVPLYLVRRFCVWTVRWMVSFQAARRFSCKQAVWGLAGAIAECYRQSHDAGRRGPAAAEVRGQGSAS
jgi:glucosyl-dolichyl phosphate glucuronosyltransferase